MGASSSKAAIRKQIDICRDPAADIQKKRRAAYSLSKAAKRERDNIESVVVEQGGLRTLDGMLASPGAPGSATFDVDVLSPTSPVDDNELRRWTLRALSYLSQNPYVSQEMINANLLHRFQSIGRWMDQPTLKYALRLLKNMVIFCPNRHEFIAEGGLYPVLQLLTHPDFAIQSHALAVLSFLSTLRDAQVGIARFPHSISCLIDLLNSNDRSAAKNALLVLSNMTSAADIRGDLLAAGLLNPLFVHLSSSSVDYQSKGTVAMALGNLALDRSFNRNEVLTHPALSFFLQLVLTNDPQLVRKAGRALSILCSSHQDILLVAHQHGLASWLRLASLGVSDNGAPSPSPDVFYSVSPEEEVTDGRFKGSEFYELRLYGCLALCQLADVRHRCENCGKSIGEREKRFHCQQCQNFDLCEVCHSKSVSAATRNAVKFVGMHSSSHLMSFHVQSFALDIIDQQGLRPLYASLRQSWSLALREYASATLANLCALSPETALRVLSEPHGLDVVIRLLSAKTDRAGASHTRTGSSSSVSSVVTATGSDVAPQSLDIAVPIPDFVIHAGSWTATSHIASLLQNASAYAECCSLLSEQGVVSVLLQLSEHLDPQVNITVVRSVADCLANLAGVSEELLRHPQRERFFRLSYIEDVIVQSALAKGMGHLSSLANGPRHLFFSHIDAFPYVILLCKTDSVFFKKEICSTLLLYLQSELGVLHSPYESDSFSSPGSNPRSPPTGSALPATGRSRGWSSVHTSKSRPKHHRHNSGSDTSGLYREPSGTDASEAAEHCVSSQPALKSPALRDASSPDLSSSSLSRLSWSRLVAIYEALGALCGSLSSRLLAAATSQRSSASFRSRMGSEPPSSTGDPSAARRRWPARRSTSVDANAASSSSSSSSTSTSTSTSGSSSSSSSSSSSYESAVSVAVADATVDTPLSAKVVSELDGAAPGPANFEDESEIQRQIHEEEDQKRSILMIADSFDKLAEILLLCFSAFARPSSAGNNVISFVNQSKGVMRSATAGSVLQDSQDAESAAPTPGSQARSAVTLLMAPLLHPEDSREATMQILSGSAGLLRSLVGICQHGQVLRFCSGSIDSFVRLPVLEHVAESVWLQFVDSLLLLAKCEDDIILRHVAVAFDFVLGMPFTGPSVFQSCWSTLISLAKSRDIVVQEHACNCLDRLGIPSHASAASRSPMDERFGMQSFGVSSSARSSNLDGGSISKRSATPSSAFDSLLSPSVAGDELRLKVSFNGEMRVLPLPREDVSLSEIRSLLLEMFSLNLKITEDQVQSVLIQYKDADGDMITIRNDQDWGQALALVLQYRTIKVFLSVETSKNPALHILHSSSAVPAEPDSVSRISPASAILPPKPGPADRPVLRAEHSSSSVAGSSTGKIAHVRWKKGEFLGEGAYGKVFLGLENTSGRFIAIKEVSIAKAIEEGTKLEQEIQVMKKLQHPNIVQYLGVERGKDNTLNILLEYVPGGSIQSLLKRFGCFEEPIIRTYLKQILEGLAYLHDNGIVHRDIKGANILVDDKGVIKLADFGASKTLEGIVQKPLQGIRSLCGSPYWMSPEMIRQQGHDKETDIWSVGATVYEMIAGRPPWSHLQVSNKFALMFKIASAQEPPALPDGVKVSDEGKDFLRLCFQKDPKKRPTVHELLQHPFVTTQLEDEEEFDDMHSGTSSFDNSIASLTGGAALVDERATSDRRQFQKGAASAPSSAFASASASASASAAAAAAAAAAATTTITAATTAATTAAQAVVLTSPPMDFVDRSAVEGNAVGALPVADSGNPDHMQGGSAAEAVAATTASAGTQRLSAAEGQTQPPFVVAFSDQLLRPGDDDGRPDRNTELLAKKRASVSNIREYLASVSSTAQKRASLAFLGQKSLEGDDDGPSDLDDDGFSSPKPPPMRSQSTLVLLSGGGAKPDGDQGVTLPSTAPGPTSGQKQLETGRKRSLSISSSTCLEYLHGRRSSVAGVFAEGDAGGNGYHRLPLNGVLRPTDTVFSADDAFPRRGSRDGTTVAIAKDSLRGLVLQRPCPAPHSSGDSSGVSRRNSAERMHHANEGSKSLSSSLGEIRSGLEQIRKQVLVEQLRVSGSAHQLQSAVAVVADREPTSGSASSVGSDQRGGSYCPLEPDDRAGISSRASSLSSKLSVVVPENALERADPAAALHRGPEEEEEEDMPAAVTAQLLRCGMDSGAGARHSAGTPSSAKAMSQPAGATPSSRGGLSDEEGYSSGGESDVLEDDDLFSSGLSPMTSSLNAVPGPDSESAHGRKGMSLDAQSLAPQGSVSGTRPVSAAAAAAVHSRPAPLSDTNVRDDVLEESSPSLELFNRRTSLAGNAYDGAVPSSSGKSTSPTSGSSSSVSEAIRYASLYQPVVEGVAQDPDERVRRFGMVGGKKSRKLRRIKERERERQRENERQWELAHGAGSSSLPIAAVPLSSTVPSPRPSPMYVNGFAAASEAGDAGGAFDMSAAGSRRSSVPAVQTAATADTGRPVSLPREPGATVSESAVPDRAFLQQQKEAGEDVAPGVNLRTLP